jgi:hypothetical protein
MFARINTRDRSFGVAPEYSPDELPEFSEERIDEPLPPRVTA